MDFDRYGKCPICKKTFRDDACPHSLTQVIQHLEDHSLETKIRKIVRDEVGKMMKEARETV